jgi:hypothetical protein
MVLREISGVPNTTFDKGVNAKLVIHRFQLFGWRMLVVVVQVPDEPQCFCCREVVG